MNIYEFITRPAAGKPLYTRVLASSPKRAWRVFVQRFPGQVRHTSDKPLVVETNADDLAQHYGCINAED